MVGGEDRAPHHRASLRYRLAALEARRGNVFEAAALLKQVIERTEAHPDWLLHYSGRGARSVGTLSLYRAALQELTALRSTS
jgi:hypothetical protein